MLIYNREPRYFIYDLVYDMLALALFLKLLWDTKLATPPHLLFLIGVFAIPFLLGTGWRFGSIAWALRIGIGIAGLILFIGCLSSFNRTFYYASFFISIMVYCWARIIRRNLYILIGLIIIVIVIFSLYTVKYQ